MPKTITITIACAGCPETRTLPAFDYPGPPPLQAEPEGWLSISMAGSVEPEHEYLSPTCAARLPASVLEALRLKQDRWRLAPVPYPAPVAPTRLAEVEAKIRRLADEAITEAEGDCERAAHLFVDRLDALPPEETGEIVVAAVGAASRAILSMPPGAIASTLGSLPRETKLQLASRVLLVVSPKTVAAPACTCNGAIYE